MLIVSHYLLDKADMQFPDHAILRVNVAWLNTLDELKSVLKKLKHDIYLDYPQGRVKPPKPKITLDETIGVANLFPNVKYFAVSNVEEPGGILDIKNRLPKHIEMIPKIETERGILNLENIVRKTGVGAIMFDKEDLYSDVNHDAEKFNALMKLTWAKGQKLGIKVLETHGVVFLPRKYD